jgi:hypothetical protein
MAEPMISYPLVTQEAFPHGLCCAGCHREVELGEPYAERPEGVTADGVVVVSLVCLPCSLLRAE